MEALELTRRELLATFLGAPAALAAGCSPPVQSLPLEGAIVGASAAIGHRLRDGVRPTPAADRWQNVGVVIVGGGIAGLATAWRLRRAGFQDFVVLELEPRAGGTSRGDSLGGIPCPWGAHYVPAPLKENGALVALLDEMGVLEGRDGEGEPVVAEQFLCRDPQERLFFAGEWHEGLYPHEGESEADRRDWTAFQAEISKWVAWRDAHGRRAFTIPVASCSDDADVTALDRISMADWLAGKNLTSSRLRWLADYSCRDDFGLTVEQTSAWAGLFYFASRVRTPWAEPQSLITWPEGNGRIVDHLSEPLGGVLRSGWAVSELVPKAGDEPGVDVVAVSHDGSDALGFHTRQAVFCAPHYLASHLIRGFGEVRGNAAREFQYGSWMVANLLLRDRPRESGFPLAWDNVLYESPSLGYVSATHQQGIDRGPAVFTYYYPVCDDDPRAGRARLAGLSWNECAEIVLSDLSRAHPDIRGLVTRLDVMHWGHAMIRPRPGFVWSAARLGETQPFGPIRFANTDLSGVALFEEAFYHGVRAAEDILRERGIAFDTLL
ncbi:MAG: FAD-dependent oxidoreductase [Planctomycetia bacterium]|nr:FAD-dependent oxidoreductase [Planctomycetia bacterium]